jgi:hypothetical protein
MRLMGVKSKKRRRDVSCDSLASCHALLSSVVDVDVVVVVVLRHAEIVRGIFPWLAICCLSCNWCFLH